MTFTFAKWEAAQACTDGPEPGATALLAWLIANDPDGTSLGVFNCRDVRGSTTTSTHGEGRAVDWRQPQTKTGNATKQGYDLLARLADHGDVLGVQCIIYGHSGKTARPTIWSAVSPDGRPYTGAHPHADHIHIELTRDAAATLTLARIHGILGGNLRPPDLEPDAPAAPAPAPKGGTTIGAIVNDLPVLRGKERPPYKTSPDVKTVQAQATHRWGLPTPIDGQFGPDTIRKVREIQQRGRAQDGRVLVDGIVGPQSWALLLLGHLAE